MRATFRRGLAVVAAVVLMAVPAGADPPGSPFPDADDAVGTGARSAQGALNALAIAYNAGNPVVRVASWDADGPSPITPRQGAAPIPRPRNSDQGIAELKRAGTATNFARSSRKRVDAAEPVLYLPFASDVVRYAVANTTNAPVNLSSTELFSIYNCTATTWSAVRPGGSSATIAPVLPVGSDSARPVFLTAIGLTTPGACVVDVAADDPTPISGNPNRIGPFTEHAHALLPSPKPVQLNTTGFSALYKVFTVVRDVNGGGPTNGGVEASLQPFLGNGLPTPTGVGAGWICGSTALAPIASNAFTQLTAAQSCGRAQ
ncbi:substrate-binding domain-containing protein [Actinokineospora sp. NBRC 105648]|uniref:substrate-binding domain-containing protein n=1 Tax=Actinokineospora sp. NBRC 105648 TaxID=3032206 RepID=UPI0024A1B688|nr:substrate-binding domain-containing protein [Actinokineospora sp. NBRC 105648]GLZ41332.1 hypothetical protein Acsp05_49560 [Actinokineospora sp. NBRC 105648]